MRGNRKRSANGGCNANPVHGNHTAGTTALIAKVPYTNPYTERQSIPYEAVIVLDTVSPQHSPVLKLRAAQSCTEAAGCRRPMKHKCDGAYNKIKYAL